jgi:phospholipase C
MPVHSADPDTATDQLKTATPIKHVIVVIGENRTFDHIYGTYVPKSRDSILNLLSEGVVNADGSPGPNFAAAKQYTTSGQTSYFIGVDSSSKTAYTTLPAPTLGGAPNVASMTMPPFTGLTDAQLAVIEPSLEPSDLFLLTTGATGAAVTSGAPDMRIANYAALPNGPFQLTGPGLAYDTYTGDTAHRFYQMWQQSDCNIQNATEDNPVGCLNDLYPFVMTTYGGPTADHGGGTSMAFYNMQDEDAPLFKKLADEYTISDNYHQPGQGGTGIQHVFLGTGDDVYWSDGNGNPTVPPTAQIANPNPQTGTNNRYTVDGRFSNCSDVFNAPGVSPIVSYLDSLPYPVEANCEVGHYYMLNNTSPGFLPNGAVDTAGITAGTSIPPSSVRTIGDALNEKNISWAYYGGAYNAAVNLANGSKDPADAVGTAYCNICNFESYATSIMGDTMQRTLHIKDATDFYAAVGDGTLPAVAFVKPDGLLDGHPASSKLDLFEGMLQKIVDTLDGNPALKAETALIITFDEGGGYYDSGFIQPLDFFGDGPRIPLVVVSPYSTGGHVVHSYGDHASILKFIERNWHLTPLTGRSRDNLPNPRADKDNPYVPVNSPAIGDLFDMFDFRHQGEKGTH